MGSIGFKWDRTPSEVVTFKCAGCGVRKPAHERMRGASRYTVCGPACVEPADSEHIRMSLDPQWQADCLALDLQLRIDRGYYTGGLK